MGAGPRPKMRPKATAPMRNALPSESFFLIPASTSANTTRSFIMAGNGTTIDIVFLIV